MATDEKKVDRAARAGARAAGLHWNSITAPVLRNAARFILEGDESPWIVKAMKPQFREAVRRIAAERAP